MTKTFVRVSRPFSDAALPAILVSNLFKIKVENIISMKRNICTPPAHNTTNQVVPLCLGCFGAGESPLEICHCVSDGKWHDGRSRSGRQSRDAAPDPVADFSHGYRQTAGIPHRLQSNKFTSSHTSFSAVQTNKFVCYLISFRSVLFKRFVNF